MATGAKRTLLRMDSHKEDLESQVFPLQGRNPDQAVKSKAKKLCCIFLAMLVLFIGLFALITWLAIRPVHSPTYSIDNIQVNTFAVENSTLDASFAFNVTAINENRKVDFKYDWITIDASYGGQTFGRGSIAGFKQGKRSTTTRAAEINVRNVTLPEQTATSIAAAIRNGSVPLRAYAKAKIHAKIGKYASFPLNVDVDCRIVVVPGSSGVAPEVVSKVCKLTRPRYRKARKFKAYKPINSRGS